MVHVIFIERILEVNAENKVKNLFRSKNMRLIQKYRQTDNANTK